MLFPPFTSPTLLPFFSLCRGLLSCRRRLGERRRPSPATSTHQAGLFPFLCAKSGTADPNVSYLYSDLTQLRAYMCILPANIDFFFARNHRVCICAPISYICWIRPLFDFLDRILPPGFNSGFTSVAQW